MKRMDEKKICFIICSNDAPYTEECLYYISHLSVPDGYQTEVLTVEDAASMAAGYNEGMRASDAKYKVYLHQDVFIVNPSFISDFLEIFASDERIGMIGMVGSPKLPESGIMWEGERCGALFAPAYGHDSLVRFGGDTLTEVEVIDGLLIITQYDIPWREDLFDKWDFYDCSQSQEFIRKGYKVVVPYMETPWCLHDNTVSDLTVYHGERMKFLQEYFAGSKALEQEQREPGITVILITSNRLQLLQDTLQWLQGVEGISNLVIVDNGSQDGTAQWLAAQEYEYLAFDEGITGYGRLWNAALTNFEMEECVVFLEAGVYPGKESLAELERVLRVGDIGAASPVSNCFFSEESPGMIRRENLSALRQNAQAAYGDQAYHKTLCANWKIWAAHKRTFDEIGLFREELDHPEEVLKDYSLRMINGQCGQAVCLWAHAYEGFFGCGEIYGAADRWQSQDRIYMKNVYGMNYFNLRPNPFLVDCIQEEREAQFSVLEVGCDLGATLYAIQSRFPNCKIFGTDINVAAVDIAKQIVNAAYGNIEELKIPFEEKFDYIIFGDVLEHLRDPEGVIVFCKELLKENGYLVACIPNVMHVSVMEQLIDGRFHYEDQGLLDRTHIHMFTYYEITHMFVNAGYTVKDIQGRPFPVSDRQEQIISALLSLSNRTEDWMYRTFQYVMKAQKQDANSEQGNSGDMPADAKLVSVIMPAYNAEKYIGAAMESVMKQTYSNVELVVVDDASTDHTLDIIRQYANVWQGRIRISARQQNGGTAAALNDAIELAEGAYICWLSADDLYCEDMVESEVHFIKQHSGCDAVFSRCAFIDENNRFLGEQPYTYNKDFLANGMEGIIARLLLGNFWHGCSVLAKAECFKKGERFNVAYRGAQDYDFWLRMAADYTIGYLDKVNVLARMHSEQGSRTINCRVDEIDVFFHLLCREDLMLKLFQKMHMAYTYSNILPYINIRAERYQDMEAEMNAMSQGLKQYMDMIEKGQIHFQS